MSLFNVNVASRIRRVLKFYNLTNALSRAAKILTLLMGFIIICENVKWI